MNKLPFGQGGALIYKSTEAKTRNDTKTCSEIEKKRWAKVKADPELHKLFLEQRKKQKSYAKNKPKTMADWPKLTCQRKKSECKRAGIEFSLTPADIIVPELCPIRLVKLVAWDKTNKADSPSLDRLNPKLGYIPSNVRVISVKANTLKNDCDDPETFRRLANYIEITRNT